MEHKQKAYPFWCAFCFRGDIIEKRTRKRYLTPFLLGEDEELVDTVRRIGEKKLGVALEPVKLISEGKSDRGNFTLFMHDYEARVAEGEPHIVSDDYTEFKWAEPHKHLESMEVMGDCCRLYKESLEADKSSI